MGHKGLQHLDHHDEFTRFCRHLQLNRDNLSVYKHYPYTHTSIWIPMDPKNVAVLQYAHSDKLFLRTNQENKQKIAEDEG